MSKFLLLGGERRPVRARLRNVDYSFRHALIAELDLDSGKTDIRVVYDTPADACPDSGPSSVFKAGTLCDGVLYAPTETEVLIYRCPELELEARLSLACFNDVHHVAPRANGNLLVVSTGLDMVFELSRSGDVVREWCVLDETPWSRFSREVDYRRLEVKPHQSHPNFVFEADGEIWATRFHQRDAVCLTARVPPFEIGVERPHDGVAFEDGLYFTTVDGQVLEFDRDSRALRRRVDLNDIRSPGDGAPLGWCRSICPLDRSRVLVGFSRLRPTRFQENLHWVKRRLRGARAGSRPSRIALYDLERRGLLQEHLIEEAGLNAVFSIHRT